MKFLIPFVSLLLLTTQLYAQKAGIENVEVKQLGNKIWVNYDLIDPADRTYIVTLFVSTDGGVNFSNPLKSVSQDVGFNVSSGEGKRIIWDVLTDRQELKGDEIIFQIEAEPIIATHTSGNLRYDIIECKGSGTTVTLTMIVNNLGRLPISLQPCNAYYRKMPFMTTDGNYQLNASYVSFDGKEMIVSHKINESGQTLPQEYSGKIIIRFDDVPTQVTKILGLTLFPIVTQQGGKKLKTPVSFTNLLIQK